MGQAALRGRPLHASLNMDVLDLESLGLDGLKLVEYGSYRSWESQPRLVELFDVQNDPEEQHDLAALTDNVAGLRPQP